MSETKEVTNSEPQQDPLQRTHDYYDKSRKKESKPKWRWVGGPTGDVEPE